LGWANIQKPGKYITDNKFSSTAWDNQPGCAPIIWSIQQQDPPIHFTREN
jgi:hypothetical protein